MSGKKLLTDMEITEISLVDEPANEDARVVIVKSKDGFKPCDDCGDPAGCMKKASCAAKGKVAKASVEAITDAVLAAIEELTPEIVAKAMAGGLPAETEVKDTATAVIKEFLMDIEAISKALQQAEASIVAITKRAEEAEAKVTALEAVVKAKDAEISKGKSPEVDPDEEFLKSAPAAVRERILKDRARIAEQDAAIAKARDEAEVKEAVEKARAYTKVAKPEDMGPALLRIRKGKSTEDDAKLIEQLLAAAAASTAIGAIFKSIGTANAVEGDPEAVLKAKAEEIQKANSGMTYAQAYDRALSENPEVYSAYIAKRRSPAA